MKCAVSLRGDCSTCLRVSDCPIYQAWRYNDKASQAQKDEMEINIKTLRTIQKWRKEARTPPIDKKKFKVYQEAEITILLQIAMLYLRMRA